MAVDMNMNVLIVDDYKTMLRILRNLLKQLNFNNIEIKEDKLTELKFFNNTLSNFENNKLKNIVLQ